MRRTRLLGLLGTYHGSMQERLDHEDDRREGDEDIFPQKESGSKEIRAKANSNFSSKTVKCTLALRSQIAVDNVMRSAQT